MKKILVVEDERLLSEAYALALKAAGYKVALAFDGQEAIEQIAKEVPDLILLDLLMPKLDGVGFLHRSGLKKKLPQVKIILFSNISSYGKIQEAMSLGVTKHIVKSSLTPKQLLLEVENILK